MMFQIIVLLIIAISVNGIAPDQEQIYAVSSQSYHRGDVPLSYQFSAVHIYSTPEPTTAQQPYSYDKANTKHSTIQYAPIAHNLFQNIQTRNNIAPEEESKTTAEDKKAEAKELNYEALNNNEHYLEPKDIQENEQDIHGLKYRSYVPGNNIEVLSPHTAYEHDDVYHKLYQNQKVNIPKFIYKKMNEPFQPAHNAYNGAEQTHLSEDDNVLYRFLAKPNTQKHQPYALNPTYKAKLPLLHLNVARMYGVARSPQQAPLKPPTHTQAIFGRLQPQNVYKTILYPVKNLHQLIHAPNINN